MKVVELLNARAGQWRELESLCHRCEDYHGKLTGPVALRFAALYRAACADLALADAYQLPPNTVNYLHQLVARAHNQLYRGRRWDKAGWARELFNELPARLLRDGYLRVAFLLFWGLFISALLLVRVSDNFGKQLVDEGTRDQMREMYENAFTGRDVDEYSSGFAMYVFNNAGIGLKCFASGLLFGIGGLFTVIYNALHLGGVFGYMSTLTGAERQNFFEFVTAHGPFELTAIVLSAAAGMRMGFALITTGGKTRAASLAAAAREAFPTACLGMVLFILAAVIEGFISPSSLPYWVKALVAAASSGLLLYYFLVLGLSGEARDARPE